MAHFENVYKNAKSLCCPLVAKIPKFSKSCPQNDLSGGGKQ